MPISGIKLNARCHLFNEPHRRGRVAFVGQADALPGPPGAPWIGVALDEPTGKNDGSVKGERYFQCERNQGAFVRADRVIIGDFPVLPLDEDDPTMEEF